MDSKTNYQVKIEAENRQLKAQQKYYEKCLILAKYKKHCKKLTKKNKELEKQLKEALNRKKGKKRKREGPRNVWTPYTCFSKKMHALNRQANGQNKKKKTDGRATLGIMSKKVSKQWKLMTDEEKKPFIKESEEDKKRYKKELEEFKSTGSFGSNNNVVKKQKTNPSKSTENTSSEEEEEEEEYDTQQMPDTPTFEGFESVSDIEEEEE